jgi:hypothetical protein
MNFKDIAMNDIITFLNLNKQPIDDPYNRAINLINDATVDITLTEPVDNWLIAYENQDIKSYQGSFDDYDFLEKDIQSIIQILKYLNKYLTIYSLPEDVFFQILINLNELEHIKYVNKYFNDLYKKLKNNNHFWHEWCKLFLIRKGYTDMTIPLNVNHIFDKLHPPSGNIITYGANQINYCEPFTKIITIHQDVIFITKNGKCLFRDNMMLNIDLKIDDIAYLKNYYLLSGGKIYILTYLPKINIFSYNSRQNILCNYKNCIIDSPDIDNIISLTVFNNKLYMLKTNGDLFEYNELIYQQVKYCEADKKHLYFITFNNQLIIDMKETDYKFDKLVKSPKILLFKSNECYFFDKEPILYSKNVKTGSFTDDYGCIVDIQGKLINKDKIYDNVVNVTIVPNLDCVYIIQKIKK